MLFFSTLILAINTFTKNVEAKEAETISVNKDEKNPELMWKLLFYWATCSFIFMSFKVQVWFHVLLWSTCRFWERGQTTSFSVRNAQYDFHTELHLFLLQLSDASLAPQVVLNQPAPCTNKKLVIKTKIYKKNNTSFITFNRRLYNWLYKILFCDTNIALAHIRLRKK